MQKGDEGALNQNDNGIYHCEACQYTFPAEEEVTQCPDCGKFTVRLATKQEQDEYFQYRQEFATENY